MNKCFSVLFLLFLVTSCKSNQEIIGLATNAKDGASIRTSNGVYIIESLNSWNDSINGKKIKALVKIKNKSNLTKDDLYDSINKTYKQGRIGNTTSVKLKKIELIK